LFPCRIQEAIAEGLPGVDTDGSYLYSKQQTLLSKGAILAPVPPPDPPLAGWELVTDSNVDILATLFPNVTSLYEV